MGGVIMLGAAIYNGESFLIFDRPVKKNLIKND